MLYVGDTVNLCDSSHSPVSDVIEREVQHNQPTVRIDTLRVQYHLHTVTIGVADSIDRVYREVLIVP